MVTCRQICWFLTLSVVLMSASTGCAPKSADRKDPEKARIQEFINGYFESWSEKDMRAYRLCFLDKSTIYYRDDAGDTRRYELEPFMAMQKHAHARASENMVEIPTSMRIERRGDVAQVTARWLLRKGMSNEEGTDCFTLVMTPDGWRIVTLVFESD